MGLISKSPFPVAASAVVLNKTQDSFPALDHHQFILRCIHVGLLSVRASARPLHSASFNKLLLLSATSLLELTSYVLIIGRSASLKTDAEQTGAGIKVKTRFHMKQPKQ